MAIVHAYDLYVALVAATMAVVRRCPIEGVDEAAGAVIGAVAHRLSSRKRLASEQRVEKAFAGTMPDQQKRTIVKDSFRHFWQDQLADSRRHGAGDQRVIGLDRVTDALGRGRGVILWESSQFGRRMTAKRILHNAGLALHQVHSSDHIGELETGPCDSALRRKVLQRFFDKQELRFVASIVRLSRCDAVAGSRTLLRLLRDNEILCMGNDGAYGQKILSVPFLGHARRFATGFVTLAHMSGATMLPMFCVEAPAGGSHVIIEEPISWDKTLDRDQAVKSVAERYTALLEFYVRRYPGEYRTWHHLRPDPPTPADGSSSS